jgi:hypothetical protein
MTRLLHKAKNFDIGQAENAAIRPGAARWLDKSSPLVVANHLRRHTGCFRASPMFISAAFVWPANLPYISVFRPSRNGKVKRHTTADRCPPSSHGIASA